MKPDSQRKRIDVGQVVKYLNHAFARARSSAGKNIDVRAAEIEFCYMIDQIQRGPIYISPKVIADANELIAQIGGTQQQQ